MKPKNASITQADYIPSFISTTFSIKRIMLPYFIKTSRVLTIVYIYYIMKLISLILYKGSEPNIFGILRLGE